MEKQELRYGNKLLFLNEIVTFEFIDQIREDGIFWIQVEEQKIAHKNFHFKPIQLTEDILLKCGFESFEDGWYGLNKFGLGYEFTWNMYDKIVRWKGSCIKCESLNQLQNLYFALTNEELNIQL